LFFKKNAAELIEKAEFCRMISAMLKKLIILPIRLYQLIISPILGPSKCRYKPTCSYYAVGAIQEWGIFKGLYLAVKRVLRCHPWSAHPMYDPVPLKKKQPKGKSFKH
jgi:hypothetical protein